MKSFSGQIYSLCLSLPNKEDLSKREFNFLNLDKDEEKCSVVHFFKDALESEGIEIFAVKDYQIMTEKGLFVVFKEGELIEGLIDIEDVKDGQNTKNN
jgi:hypothetical protein